MLSNLMTELVGGSLACPDSAPTPPPHRRASFCPCRPFSQDKLPGQSNTLGSLPPKAPRPEAPADDNPFGTRKARASFGRGFFKIKSSKRTASAPNLGKCGRSTFASGRRRDEAVLSPPLPVSFSAEKVKGIRGRGEQKRCP